MKKIGFLILLLFSVINIIAQNSILEGKLIVTNPEDLEIAKNEVQIYLISCEPDEFANVNDNLTFKFENIKAGDYELLFFPYAETNYLNRNIHIDSGETITIDVEYFYNCKYDVSKDNKTCPKCKKTNRVISTSHSFFYDKKSYSLGCIKSDCEPNWYCKRDKLEF
jgi:RNA polymerase subunit RPABC4/transcription elongation factor Spt4